MGGQQDECVVRRDRGRGLEQVRQRVGELPAGPVRAVPVGWRVEDDPVVAASPSTFTGGERQGVIDDPADGPVGEAGQLGVPPRPRDRGPSAVDVGHAGSRPHERERRRPRRGEQVQDRWRFAVGDGLAEPRPERRVLGEEPDLSGRGGSKLQPEAVELDQPRRQVGPLPTRLAVPAEVGSPPC